MNTNINQLEELILENKKKYEKDSHNIKNYMECLNTLAEVYIEKKDWLKAQELLDECINVFPNSYRVLSTGLYRRVGIICSINYYLVSQKLNNNENIKKFEEIKDLIYNAEHEDIQASNDKRVSDEANILNRIEIYKKIYETNLNSSDIQKEKEVIFKKFFWSKHYSSHNFSWE